MKSRLTPSTTCQSRDIEELPDTREELPDPMKEYPREGPFSPREELPNPRDVMPDPREELPSPREEPCSKWGKTSQPPKTTKEVERMEP